MKNIIAIVQARMTSTRLPGKVLLDLAGKPVLSQVFNQLSFSKLITESVLATSIDPSDDPLERWANNKKKNLFRGSLENVLERFYQTAKKFKADVIIRITADCPLIEPKIVDKCIENFVRGSFDYYSNINPPTFPDGLDCEVFKYSVLKESYRNAKLKSEIEHVTPYIRNNAEKFKIGNYASEINYENYRWTLDNREDYKLLQSIYKVLYEEGKYISLNSVLKFLKDNPILLNINSNIERNEGFTKSLIEDKGIK